jgi:hypothetical protein
MSNSLPDIRSPREREQPAGAVHRLLTCLPDYHTLFFTRTEVYIRSVIRSSGARTLLDFPHSNLCRSFCLETGNLTEIAAPTTEAQRSFLWRETGEKTHFYYCPAPMKIYCRRVFLEAIH